MAAATEGRRVVANVMKRRPTKSAKREAREKERRQERSAGVWLAKFGAMKIRNIRDNWRAAALAAENSTKERAKLEAARINSGEFGTLIGTTDNPAEFLRMVAGALDGKLRVSPRGGLYNDAAIVAGYERARKKGGGYRIAPLFWSIADEVMPSLAGMRKGKDWPHMLKRALVRLGLPFTSGKRGRPRKK
jgi:hypothetical protein